VDDAQLLPMLERYYDTVPRAVANAEPVGPFTLFVAREGWPYYARPRLGADATFTAADVLAVLDRQHDLRVPRHLEWVHQTTPSLLPAARQAGLRVEECALLVLDGAVRHSPIENAEVRMLDPDEPGFATARSAVDAGFSGRDVLQPEPVVETMAVRVKQGLMRVAGAFAADGGAIGGGSHALRDGVTELTGIAVVPAWRRRGVGAALTAVLADDARSQGAATVFLSAASEAVTRVYERVGFVRVGTACIAECHQ
jgi:ribosomal protein S18 acetylase RimI-like enzyme